MAAVAVGLALPAEGAEQAVGTDRAAIFYYPWYSTPARDGRWAHWYVEHEGTPTLSTPYLPTRGLYSSSNAKLVLAQMREIAASGVGTLVVSWWGFDSPEHERLLLVEEAATRYGLEVAIHVEPYRGRTPTRAAEDIQKLRREGGFTDFYLYDVVTWNGALFKRLCTQAHAVGLLCAPSVGPGYDARLATRHAVVRPRNDGLTYDRMWKTALGADADIVTITSYNEWQEGTQIEPARVALGKPSYEGAWGKTGVHAQRAYLDATARWTARLRASPRQ